MHTTIRLGSMHSQSGETIRFYWFYTKQARLQYAYRTIAWVNFAHSHCQPQL